MNVETKMPSPVQMVVEAERFVLRPLKKSDSGLLSMFLRDLRVAEMTRQIPNPLPPKYTENMIARSLTQDRTEDFWAIDGSGRGHAEVMGLFKMNRLDRNQSEIRYWVAPAFWNTGIATEAVNAMSLVKKWYQHGPMPVRWVRLLEPRYGFGYRPDKLTES